MSGAAQLRRRSITRWCLEAILPRREYTIAAPTASRPQPDEPFAFARLGIRRAGEWDLGKENFSKGFLGGLSGREGGREGDVAPSSAPCCDAVPPYIFFSPPHQLLCNTQLSAFLFLQRSSDPRAIEVIVEEVLHANCEIRGSYVHERLRTENSFSQPSVLLKSSLVIIPAGPPVHPARIRMTTNEDSEIYLSKNPNTPLLPPPPPPSPPFPSPFPSP